MFTNLIKKIAKGLEQLKIPYMIIGGQAVLLYGEPRLTKDIDITLGLGPEEVEKIVRFVQSNNWKILVPDAEKFVKETMVLPVIDLDSGIRIDFIFSFSLYEQEAMNRVKLVEIEDQEVRFASLEDLIIHKIIAGRPRDIEDVVSLIQKNPEVDEKYIRRWLQEFETLTSQPLLKTWQNIRQQGGKEVGAKE